MQIGSILAVFVCSLAGFVGAYAISKQECYQYSQLRSIVAMFSAGMMLSLGFIHITSEVILDLNEHVKFPLGACMVLAGLIVMIIFEHSSQPYKESHRDNVYNEDNEFIVSLNECTHYLDIEGAQSTYNIGEHSYPCITTLHPRNETYKSLLSFWMLEVACVFHSIFIGLSLGMIPISSMSNTYTSLTIALCFHQVLEGVSVGNLSNELHMSNIKVVLSAFVYSIAAPSGIVIGMCIDKNLVANETSTIIVLSFQGFAAGMLLYVALFQLIAEELRKKNTHTKVNQKMSLYIALLCGVSSMSIIALWL